MSSGLEISFLKARKAENRGDHADAEQIYRSILRKFPKNARALKGLERLGRTLDFTLATAGSPPQSEMDRLIASYREGLLSQASEQGEALVSRYPESLALHNILGAVYIALQEFGKAENIFRRGLAISPEYPEVYSNLGISLMRQGKLDEAVAAYRRALAIKPDYAEAHYNLGNLFRKLGRSGDAVTAYERALAIKPDYADAHNNLGMVMQEQGKLDEAIASYGRALSIRADHTEALNNLGNALLEQGNLDEAVEAYSTALLIQPGYAEAHNNLGNALTKQGKHEEAIAAYQRALAIKPDYADAFHNLGNVLKEQQNFGGAIEAYKRALAIRPDNADALNNLGNVFFLLGRLDEAIETFDRALAIKPDNDSVLIEKLHVQAHVCDWSAIEAFKSIGARGGSQGDLIPPFAVLVFEDDPEHQLQRARAWAQASFKQRPLPLPARTGEPGGRIRIGYFSADFHNHATLYLMSGLFREHDRQRFEIYAYSYGATASDEMRERLVRDVDCFADIRAMPDLEIVELARSHGLHIAIDLKGYTQNSRSQLFAYRLAPIQINYLGYPGSLGADFIDYFIADPVVVPEAERQFYSEKVIILPNSYQPNDNRREIASTATTRADFGLPSDGFVFCCFNQNYKIGPREFDIWMRLLAKVDGSVLWLLRSNEWAEANLRREAVARGIDPGRLIFADSLPHAEHLARLGHADLFLDTFNVNAHTTASDALWAGVPVVTKAGRQFAARVGASLVSAVGLPELVTATEEAYEALVLELATAPGKLAAIRSSLAANRLTQPLFDTALYARHLEAAYQAAWRRYSDGQEPAEIVIA